MPFIKGYVPTQEHRDRLNETLKERGIKPKQRYSNKGIPMSEEQKKKISEKLKGHGFSKESLKKMSESRKDQVSPMKGKKHTEETKRKLSLSKRGKRTGKNNNMWKGGISKPIKKLRSSAEYKDWRTNCFKRDNYICQKCGFKGYVTVHHIKSVCKHIDLIFNLKNGVTLCEKCHSMTDNYKGRARKK